MSVPTRHILQQGPVIAALGRTALLAMKQKLPGAPRTLRPAPTPGPEIHRSRPPLPRNLIDDYIVHVGGDPGAYANEVPPHLFPQWCMPALARTLDGLTYPLLRAVNGGCRIRVAGRIPDREALHVRARLQDIDENERRAVLHQSVATGPSSNPDALTIDFYTIVPLARARASANGRSSAKAEGSADKERPRVPADARAIARTERSEDAGLTFAKLTGDFNPIHWLTPYARASGFPNVIQHGFASLALAWEAITKHLLRGDVHAIESFDVKLSRPLVLPRTVGIYVLGNEVFLGDAPGELAYLTGSFTARGVS